MVYIQFIYTKINNIYKDLIKLEINLFYIFSTVFNPTTVVLSIGGDGFLSMIAAMEAAAKTTTQAITIPAIAPPDKPLEFFL